MWVFLFFILRIHLISFFFLIMHKAKLIKLISKFKILKSKHIFPKIIGVEHLIFDLDEIRMSP